MVNVKRLGFPSCFCIVKKIRDPYVVRFALAAYTLIVTMGIALFTEASALIPYQRALDPKA